MKKILIFLLLAATAIGVVVFVYIQRPLPLNKEVDIDIPRGGTAKAFATLTENKAIRQPLFFEIIARAYGIISGHKLQAGIYRLSPQLSHAQLIKALFTGRQPLTVNVSFPEGIGIKKMASICARELGIDSALFMKAATNDSLLRYYDIPGNSLEGYLMPDTYNFYWKQKPEEIIQKMLGGFLTFWDEECQDDAQEQKRTRHQILTLASIVEAEAALPEERKRISGVYMNRLKKDMKLEADPTVQYAIGMQKRLLYSDLEVNNPYNTYKFLGLPPGPINCPGRASIQAALQPEEHDYLYFVATGDGTGAHNFSTNADQHQKAVALYRKRRAAR